MSEVIVDTNSLNQYGNRIERVNKRVTSVAWEIKSLYFHINIADLWDVIKADLFSHYSLRLKKCQAFLFNTADLYELNEKRLFSDDPLNYEEKTFFSFFEDSFFCMGVGVRTTLRGVKSVFKTIITTAVESYYSQGFVFQAVQVGKAAYKCAKGVTKIALGVSSIFASGGLSAPVAVLTVISGFNDLWNGGADLYYIHTGEYDKIGETNLLKDALADSGKQLGTYFGNSELGEQFGEITYYGVEIITSLATLEQSFDKIKQLRPSDVGKLRGEISNIPKMSVMKIMTTDVEALKYEGKLASYAFPEISNALVNMGAIFEVSKDTYKVATKVDDALCVFHDEDYENPVIEVVDTVSDIVGYVGEGVKYPKKVMKKIFG